MEVKHNPTQAEKMAALCRATLLFSHASSKYPEVIKERKAQVAMDKISPIKPHEFHFNKTRVLLGYLGNIDGYDIYAYTFPENITYRFWSFATVIDGLLCTAIFNGNSAEEINGMTVNFYYSQTSGAIEFIRAVTMMSEQILINSADPT